MFPTLSIPKFTATYAIGLFLLVLGMVSVIYSRTILPFLWIILALITVSFFFTMITNTSIRWRQLWGPPLIKNIFVWAFLVRLGYVIFSYFFYTIMTGQPFEFGSADAYGYHIQGLNVAESLRSGEWNFYERHLMNEKVSSTGYITFLGFIYAIFFDSIFIARVFNALLGAWVCVIIYRVALRSFDEATARLAAILAVFAPPMIYYTGVHLKEHLMMVVVILFIDTADRILRARNVLNPRILLLIALAASLFFFRNALAIAMILSFLMAVFFSSKRVSAFSRRFAIAFFALIIGSTFFFVDFASEIQKESAFYFNLSESNLEQRMEFFATREGGNRLATLASASVFAPLVVVGPLPTLSNTNQYNIMMLAGSMFTRNIIVFFVLVALYTLFRKKRLRDHILLLSVLVSWLFILANSGYALSDRFHLVVVPLLLIFAGFGISYRGRYLNTPFLVYLIIVGTLIIAWNVFKLVGRGLA